MENIRHDLTGYRIPSYVEEILTQNYCPGFMNMSMIKENEKYQFSYRPGVYKRLEYRKLDLYEKTILMRSLITLSEMNKEHLIRPESYLLEPELIYLRDGCLAESGVKIMYYPDVKALSFRYKLILFADRILEKGIREERDALDQLRRSSETGDMNRIKMMLDKQIMRLENRMSEGRIFS